MIDYFSEQKIKSNYLFRGQNKWLNIAYAKKQQKIFEKTPVFIFSNILFLCIERQKMYSTKLLVLII